MLAFGNQLGMDDPLPPQTQYTAIPTPSAANMQQTPYPGYSYPGVSFPQGQYQLPQHLPQQYPRSPYQQNPQSVYPPSVGYPPAGYPVVAYPQQQLPPISQNPQSDVPTVSSTIGVAGIVRREEQKATEADRYVKIKS